MSEHYEMEHFKESFGHSLTQEKKRNESRLRSTKKKKGMSLERDHCHATVKTLRV